ncbi:hypothetical protein HTZ84_22145 [Haloterrigena sp. SYSU A558-1]|uniref:Transcriptional regulator n=2 Tax=Haloterrigena gelatinilytica TaxID=2741724 RepID=A0ABX2LPB1_9EURY|nr:hypothetical protein [Haloterrigena gelatinilytica]
MAAHSEHAAGGETDRPSRTKRIERRQRDIFESVEELADDPANEQVQLLADVLREMHTELCRLEARNRQLNSRLSKLEAVNGLSGDEIDLSDTSATDHRDKKVMKALVADGRERVTIDDLRELYRGHTDIRSAETLKDRIKTLTATDHFELVNRGLRTTTWRFTGLES